MPAVSINLCCWNSERFLESTLRSVFAQTYRDWELVIVNDGSTDCTEALVRKYMDGRIPIVYHAQANAGLGAARNKALELSSGEFIALIDHDDVWEPKKLEKQVSMFGRTDVGFAGSDAWFMNASGRLLFRYSDRNRLFRGNVLQELFLKNFIPCAAVMMRRRSIEAAGGFFRPEFRIAEEYELFLRLAEHSEFDFVPEPLVRIRVYPQSAGWDFDRERLELRLAYAECLERNPALAKQLGPKTLRIKESGLWLKPEEARALRGEPAPLKSRLRALAFYGLSGLGPETVDRLRRLNRSLHRLKASWEARNGKKSDLGEGEP